MIQLGPDTVASRTLDNGLTLAAFENFASPTVVMVGTLAVGAMDEGTLPEGTASMSAALLTRGTASHEYDAINEAIERVGAGVGFGSGVQSTGFSLKCLSEDLPMMLALTAEMLHTPTFPTAHLERLRAQRMTSLREREQNTGAMADWLFTRHTYPPEHPYYRQPSGTLDSTPNLTREGLVEFHRTHYGPRDGYMVLVGALPKEQALDLLSTTFSDWHADPAHPTTRTIPLVQSAGGAFHHTIAHKTQSSLIYGLPTIPRGHPDFMALQQANIILGVFGMMGRIGDIVRDQMGLAYSARSSLEGVKGPGVWAATAAVAPEKVEQALTAIQAEWARLGEEPVSDEERADCHAFLKGTLPLRLETNEGLARALMDMLYYGLGLDYLRTYATRVERITAADLQRVTRTYFDPARAVLAVAGP